MNLTQIRELVARGRYNEPLPKPMDGKRLILTLTTSRCCRGKELLVRSRDGGFVTRDCLSCGARANYVNLNQIPDLDCEACLKFKRSSTIEPILKERNYWYRCAGCAREWEISEIVPEWSEAFEYAGLLAPGDLGFLR